MLFPNTIYKKIRIMNYAKTENSIVKKYGNLKSLGDYKNYLTFWKHPVATHNSEDFFEVVSPSTTKYERLIGLIPGDFANDQFTHRIYSMNQDEIDAVDQAELDNDTSANKYSTRVNDGQIQYKRFVDKIIRDKDITPNPPITPQEALAAITNFNEGMQFLKDGFQEATKQIINGLTPANQYETDLKDLIVDKLTQYISDKPL